jgi:hypothetical protein
MPTDSVPFQTRNTAVPRQRENPDEAIEVSPFALNMKRDVNTRDFRPLERIETTETEVPVEVAEPHDVDPKGQSSSVIDPASLSDPKPDGMLPEILMSQILTQEGISPLVSLEEDASVVKENSGSVPILPPIF